MKIVQGHSLIHQIIGIVVSAQLLCAALLCGGALLYQRHIRLRALDISLQGRSDSLLGAIQDAEDTDDNVRIDPAELRLPGDDVYAVYNRGGQLLGSSPAAPPVLIGRHADEFRDAQVGRKRYRILQREAMRVIDRAETQGVGLKRPVTIVYASSESHLWREIFEAVRFYLIGIAFATGLTVALVALLLNKALHPLSELAVAAEQLSPPALAFTAPLSVMRVRELRPLADVLTDSVSRLREAFAKEQRFVGDAAHELKTAIAIVRSSVQLLMLKRRTVEQYTAGLERVLEDNRRVERLVAQMLQLASMEEASSRDAPVVDLGELVAAVLDQLRPVAEEHGVALDFSRPAMMHVQLVPEKGLCPDLQPGPERDPAYSVRRKGDGIALEATAGRGDVAGCRYRLRNLRGCIAACLRTFLPRRSLPVARDWRDRPGIVDLQIHCGSGTRQHCDQELPRRRNPRDSSPSSPLKVHP